MYGGINTVAIWNFPVVDPGSRTTCMMYMATTGMCVSALDNLHKYYL